MSQPPELIAQDLLTAYTTAWRQAIERVKALEDVDQDENTIEVWEKDPSVQAFTDLLNRYLDKPKEQEQEVAMKAEVVFKWQG